VLSLSKHERGQNPSEESARAEPVEARPTTPRYRLPWAELLQKVFAVDVLLCPDCGGRLRVLACVTEAAEVKRYLEHAGIDATGPPVAKASAGGGAARDPLPEYDLVDSIPDE
jgi:hypothetical protein